MIHRFGDLEIDTDTMALSRSGAVVPIKPRPLALLALLVENRERVVSKDEIIASVWHGKAVSDAALTTAVRDIRKAIGDVSHAAGVVRTIYGRGLKFVEPSARNGNLANGAQSDHPLAQPTRKVAVLQFDSLSDDTELSFIADGLAEDVITQLSKYRDVKVIARNSSFSMQGQGLTVREIGERLGARYVVEGSIRPIGSGKLRVTAQMIEADPQVHIWADKYDLDRACIHETVDDVTTAIVASIGTMVKVHELQRSRDTDFQDLDPWECYVHGRELMQTFNRLAQEKAITYFERAIELSPDFSDAYAFLAYSLALKTDRLEDYTQSNAGDRRTPERLGALAMAEKAIQLDPRAPIAWAALARVKIDLCEMDGGISAAEKALELNPNLTWGHNLLGLALWQLNRAEESVAALERALETSPQDSYQWVVMGSMACAMVLLGRFDDAIEWSRKAQVQPSPSHLASMGGICALGHLGQNDRAVDMIVRARHIDPDFSLALVYHDFPMPNDTARDKIIGGLQQAGLT